MGEDLNNEFSQLDELIESSAFAAFHCGAFDRAIQFVEAGLSRRSSLNRVNWKLEFIHAEIRRIRGRTDEALLRLDTLSSRVPEEPDLQARLYMHRGYCAALLGDCASGHRLLHEAHSIASEHGLQELLGETTLRRGMVHFLQEDYEKASVLYRHVFDSIGDSCGWYLYSNAMAGIAKIEMTLRHFAEAVTWFHRCLAIVEPLGAKYVTARSWGELAICHLGLGEPDLALSLLGKAGDVLLDLGAKHTYQINLADIGYVYLCGGEYFRAMSHFQAALEIAREIKDPVSIHKWTSNLHIAYSQAMKSNGTFIHYLPPNRRT